MSQLRLDPLTGRWVVISTDRAERPFAFMPRAMPVEGDPSRPCPFCTGHEDSTPPALEAYGPGGSWQVRVVPNLFVFGNEIRDQRLAPLRDQIVDLSDVKLVSLVARRACIGGHGSHSGRER